MAVWEMGQALLSQTLPLLLWKTEPQQSLWWSSCGLASALAACCLIQGAMPTHLADPW